MTDAAAGQAEPFIHLRQAFRRYRRDRDKRCNTFRYDGRYDGLWPIHIVYCRDFGPSAAGTMGRWVFSLGWATRRWSHSILLQRYAEGFELPPHTDGPAINKVWLLELRRPKEGGVFSAEGPARSWFGGRLWRFDGAVTEHGFTRVGRGGRVSLLYQRGQDRDGRAPW